MDSVGAIVGMEGGCIKRIYREKNHGITKQTIKYFDDHRIKIGIIVCVEGTQDDTGDYWTTFSDEDGNKIVCSGFAWGYYGEGPSGLHKTLGKLCLDLYPYYDDYSLLKIANFGKSFKIMR